MLKLALIILLLTILLVCAKIVCDRTGTPSGVTSVIQSGGTMLTWRNYFRPPPIIGHQPDAPIAIRNPKFYSYWSWNLGLITSVDYDVVNVSQNSIHSFSESQYTGEPFPEGILSQPESPLKPGESLHTRTGVSGKGEVTLMIDFVQFADGTTWYSGARHKTVHPDGVRAGAQAAAKHLIKVLGSAGSEAVMKALPRIHADVRDPYATGLGYFCGVTNVSVKVQHANREGGLIAIEAALQRIINETSKSP